VFLNYYSGQRKLSTGVYIHFGFLGMRNIKPPKAPLAKKVLVKIMMMLENAELKELGFMGGACLITEVLKDCCPESLLRAQALFEGGLCRAIP
jgi:hypothetical protein